MRLENIKCTSVFVCGGTEGRKWNLKLWNFSSLFSFRGTSARITRVAFVHSFS